MSPELLAGGEGPFGSLKNSKEQLATLPSKGKQGPCEYLLDCFYDAGKDALRVIAGTSEGHAAAFPIAVKDQKCALQPPDYSMYSGHSAVSIFSYLHIAQALFSEHAKSSM